MGIHILEKTAFVMEWGLVDLWLITKLVENTIIDNLFENYWIVDYSKESSKSCSGDAERLAKSGHIRSK